MKTQQCSWSTSRRLSGYIYIPYDPESQENDAAMTLAFINQSAPDIKRKLQRLEHLGEKSIRDLVKVA